MEHISGPVLTAGAGEDGTWASAAAVAQVQQRLTAHHFRFSHQGLVYGHAGHSIGIALPYLPAATDEPVRGGSPLADAAAEADLWPRSLKLLGELAHGKRA